MNAPYYQKTISLHDSRVFYVRELTVWQRGSLALRLRVHTPDLPRELFQSGKRLAHVIDAETGEETWLPISEFRSQYVKDSTPNLPPAVRAIFDAAPSWYEWRDRRKA